MLSSFVERLCSSQFLTALVLNSLLIPDFYFIFNPHSKEVSLLLSYCFVLCKDTSVRSVELFGFFVIFWNSKILIGCI